jgi:acyl-CoA thioesterase
MSADADDPFHPFGDLIGLAFTDVADGHSECTLEVSDDLKNPHGVVHGAVLYAMADTGMGGALYPGLDDEEVSTTVEVTVRYFRPVREGTVTCETEVIHRGGSLAHLASEVHHDGAAVAHAVGSFFVHETGE